MINSGVNFVVAKELYRDFKDILKMKDVTVQFIRTNEGFYEIRYEPATSEQ